MTLPMEFCIRNNSRKTRFWVLFHGRGGRDSGSEPEWLGSLRQLLVEKAGFQLSAAIPDDYDGPEPEAVFVRGESKLVVTGDRTGGAAFPEGVDSRELAEEVAEVLEGDARFARRRYPEPGLDPLDTGRRRHSFCVRYGFGGGLLIDFDIQFVAGMPVARSLAGNLAETLDAQVENKGIPMPAEEHYAVVDRQGEADLFYCDDDGLGMILEPAEGVDPEAFAERIAAALDQDERLFRQHYPGYGPYYEWVRPPEYKIDP